MRFLSRRGTVTDIKAPPALFGVAPVADVGGVVTPYRNNGTGRNENFLGNLHSHNGSTTGTTPAAASMAFSVLGNTYDGAQVVFSGSISGTTLTVHSITSGGNNLAVGMALQYQYWQDDTGWPAASSISALGTGTGGVGTYTLHEVQDTIGPVEMVAQGKYMGASGEPAFSVIDDPDSSGRKWYRHRVCFNDKRPSGQTKGAGVRKVLARWGDSGLEPSNGQGQLGSRGVPYMDCFTFLVPQATHDIIRNNDEMLIWQHKNSTGFPGAKLSLCSQWYSGSYELPQGTNGPRIIWRCWSGQAGANQPQIVVYDGYPADTPVHVVLRITPGWQASDNPKNEVWIKPQGGAITKPVDTTTRNLDSNGDSVNRQWGWYVYDDNSYSPNGVHINPATGPWWEAGDVLDLWTKGYVSAPASLAALTPTDRRIADLFALMEGQ